MYSKINTCTLQGLNGHIIEVETDLARGMPVFNIVGLPDTSIKESKERVRAAIKNSGYEFPLKRITINLAPANLRKEGSQLDLSIAIGILLSNGEIGPDNFSDTIFLGELSLDGQINEIDGALAMIISMRDLNIKRCIIPYNNKNECGIISDLEIIPVKSLKEAVMYLNKELVIEAFKDDLEDPEYMEKFDLDFYDIKGQEGLKRALEIAAAGSHNMLIIGPPGSGKTMAARRLPTILPELSFEESVEVTKIYSISGLLSTHKLIKQRPFRAPHHTCSSIALIGGGRTPKPGEVSLAHQGVLFLDELPEFSKNVLEVLRQPMEDEQVHIARVNASLTFPSKFMFVASMNPCPCGYYGDPLHECNCSQRDIDRYLGKISFPLLDRIDIHFEVQPVKYSELKNVSSAENSSEIKYRVNRAKEIQIKRFKEDKINSNSQIANRDMKKYCKLKNSSEEIMELAFKKYKFSARTHNKIIKMARTIADLDQRTDIEDNHILEAIRYRTLNNKYWG